VKRRAPKPNSAAGGRWLLLIHQLPPKPDYFRVKIWRRLQGIGAIAIKNSVYALPFSDQASEDFQWLRQEIAAGGGEASVCRAAFVDGLSDRQVEALFRTARDADYAELTRAAEKIDSPSDGARLERRLRDITALDPFGSSGRKAAEAAVTKLKTQRTKSIKRGRSWMTRKDVHVDRIASAWLIRRFIDPKARFVFGGGEAGRGGHKDAVSFDMYGGDYTHEGERCSFETLLHKFGLEQDPALRAIGEMVHDVDCKDGKFGREETAGLERMIAGIVKRHASDPVRIARGAELLDDLYESWSASEKSPSSN